MLLLLFDIDGTLLQRASHEHAIALRTAAGRVHGVDLSVVDAVEYAGRTDRAITRDLLTAAGVSEVDEAWVDETVAEYERLCPPDLSAKVAPGMVELLDALAARPDEFRLSLVTGNLEAVARRKLAAAGIGHYFEPGQGGFGSDHEERGELPAIARGRASDPAWPRERTVVIGDTPRDIACARVDEVRVAAVATGPYTVEALADADAVADDARALLPVFEDWL
ncbi:haloacid dehalogenase-like hydrolase [Solirubrobacter phytolaccae]|uniref:Haloacid dehalogenase-like hydrolase n=1 Tax=Solirubrobacter phytolaccae TaxID=1404360 RepID=A0A9X3N3B5_9ACTN|nr:haloacid dehalogenase-like hydrolase [Solirubrobacter phytolaccae]MDA0179035.1 haloacid dehalogenase-like hydrolase [Solirubrobacter phytolaccae]